MKLSLLLASLAALAAAQNSTNSTGSDGAAGYAAGLISALQSANLTTLLSIAQQNAQTLIPLISQGEHTVFAPTDAAFSALPESVTSDQQLVANTVLYHVLAGRYTPANLSAMPTIARTALNASSLVQLPGNQSQVAVLTAAQNGSVVVNQALSNVSSQGNATYQNLQIYIINEVLTVPMNLTATAQAAGLTALVGALQQYAPQVVPELDTTRGLTVFAPANSAFEAAASLIGTLNETAIANVLLNHVLNGTVVYSSQIENDQTVTSASGQPLMFMKNDTGVFVQSANVTARIVRSDVIVENGVVHIIDNILANPASNPGAAASAASSAAGAASTATAMPTGPVGGSGSGSGSGSGGGNGAGFVSAASGLLALAAGVAVVLA